MLKTLWNDVIIIWYYDEAKNRNKLTATKLSG